MSASGDLNILDGRFNRYGQRPQSTAGAAKLLLRRVQYRNLLDKKTIRRVDDVVAGAAP